MRMSTRIAFASLFGNDMHSLRPVLLIGAMLLSSACSGIQPWVKPYERDRLADPIMAWNRDAISSEYLDHTRESREGSRGATGGAGGGCGCN